MYNTKTAPVKTTSWAVWFQSIITITMHSPGGHIVLTCGLYVTSQHCYKAILLIQIPQGTIVLPSQQEHEDSSSSPNNECRKVPSGCQQLAGQEIQDSSFTVSTKADLVTQSTAWKHWRKQKALSKISESSPDLTLSSPTTRLRSRVGRRSRWTFSTDFEIFQRRFDGVVIYFFNSDFKFFHDVSEFSVASLYVVLFSLQSSC